jgi:glyoxylase-like metal-dependent hydrolase (beta-lactamase superfamily II)
MQEEDEWRIGDVSLAPVRETDAGSIIQAGIAAATPERLAEISWLAPGFADSQGKMKAVVQAFLIILNGTRVLVDTCVGNAKARPGLPEWSNLETAFLDRLATHGVGPNDIDFVICTHFHFDHVGWNTSLVEGKWLPTFPRARYIFSKHEFDYWKTRPENENADDRAGFSDSVLPVFEAGSAELVPSDHEVCDGVFLLPTPGHTPGHASVCVESRGEQAIITGDALHHPCQVAHPEWSEFSDFDPELARRSRLALLERCAHSQTLLIGSHFARPAANLVCRDAGGFRLARE